MTSKSTFQQYLFSQIFERNDVGTFDELYTALKTATELDVEKDFKERRRLFDMLYEKAPMKVDKFDLDYKDVIKFAENEWAKFDASRN